MNEPIATLGDTCDQVHRFTQVLFVPHDWRRDWLVLKVGMECFEKEFVYEYDEVRDLRDRLDRWLGDVDALRSLREYGRGLLRGDLQSDVQDPRDVQAMLHLLPSVLYPLPRMAESRQGTGGLPMSLNVKDAIVEIMSDGVGRTTPQLVDELLRMDRVWFRNICKTAVSCKCSDLVRDGVLIRAGLEHRGDHAQPLIIWRKAPSTSNRSATALNRKPEVYSCPEERRSLSAM